MLMPRWKLPRFPFELHHERASKLTPHSRPSHPTTQGVLFVLPFYWESATQHKQMKKRLLPELPKGTVIPPRVCAEGFKSRLRAWYLAASKLGDLDTRLADPEPWADFTFVPSEGNGDEEEEEVSDAEEVVVAKVADADDDEGEGDNEGSESGSGEDGDDDEMKEKEGEDDEDDGDEGDGDEGDEEEAEEEAEEEPPVAVVVAVAPAGKKEKKKKAV